MLGNKFARFDFNGNFVSNTTVPAWGIGPIRDMYVDKFNTTYVLGESCLQRPLRAHLRPAAPTWASILIPAEGTLTGSTKLVIDDERLRLGQQRGRPLARRRPALRVPPRRTGHDCPDHHR